MAKFISMDQFKGGALLGLFNSAMRQIGTNIMDPNTDPEKARTLTLKLTFKPDKSRRSMKTSFAANVSLAPPVAEETIMLIGLDARTGNIQMSEIDNQDNAISVQGNMPIRAEVVPPAQPVQTFDPETGEIYETAAPKQQAPIDLRQM